MFVYGHFYMCIYITFCDLQVLRRTSENVFVPLTVGGGIRDFTDANGRYASVLYCDLLFIYFKIKILIYVQVIY